MLNRREFLARSVAAAGLVLPGVSASCRRTQTPPPVRNGKPKLTFYGSTRQVSGSCHLLETSQGLYVIDCGLFYPDIANHDSENLQFPFEPKEVKALFLTHAHVDHNGRLPLLWEKGFRGTIYTTDASRDITEVMLLMSYGVAEGSGEEPLFSKEAIEKTMDRIEAVPYNTKLERDGLAFRFTDAGHILGSAMIEIWADGMKFLFSGDMGPDHTPILCKPTQHFGADVVLVESTYGPTPRDEVGYEEFGKRIQKVLSGGGSVLLPAFAVHKTQLLIYILHRLMDDKIIDPQYPIYSDSATAQKVTAIYNRYREYHDQEARKVGELFYRHRYREPRTEESLQTHGEGPAIYISTSGMLDHATAPKHLYLMARDPRNAVFLVGYQSPSSVGYKLQSGEKKIEIPWEERGPEGFRRAMRETEIKLTVERVSGFSSHARGQQILEWLSEFKSIGQVFVVHGDAERATGLADAIRKMGIPASAPKRDDSFVPTGDRVKPGPVPRLAAPAKPVEPAPVDR